ncbi:C2 domain containing protein [Novymonas esmeraldas]|uniref:C2 domain containing protein n=1 Tax=Novymonas esmeraldas TaxID=1808958 RepID=A0AAW0EM23_9TRYP
MATLKVTVHEARDLPIMDRATGLADPYVVVKLDDMEHTTDIARRTRNPVWGHDFRFDTADLLVLQEDPLEIRVFDHDIISRDDIVGMVLVDCNSIIYRANPAVSGWFPLLDSAAGLHGEIRLTIRIKFHAAENPLAPALPERYVRRLDPSVADRASSLAATTPGRKRQQQPQQPQHRTNTFSPRANDASISLSAAVSTPGPSAGAAGSVVQSGSGNHVTSAEQSPRGPFYEPGSSFANTGAAAAVGNDANLSPSSYQRQQHAHRTRTRHRSTSRAPTDAPGAPRAPPQTPPSSTSPPHAPAFGGGGGDTLSGLPSLPGASTLPPINNLSLTANSAANHISSSTGSYARYDPATLFAGTGATSAAAAGVAEDASATAPPSLLLPSPAVLLPFLVEQDLDPLRAARVDHPTLAAEEEGVFIFSVWRLDPAVFRVESTQSMMEELIVKADPEHMRFTNLRSSRSINDARVVQLFKLSGKVRRQLARKVVELQCNAVLGYVEEFDMEQNGIIVRAYGTPCVVSQVKYVSQREMEAFLRGTSRYRQSSLHSVYAVGLPSASLAVAAAPPVSQPHGSTIPSYSVSPIMSIGTGAGVVAAAAAYPPPAVARTLSAATQQPVDQVALSSTMPPQPSREHHLLPPSVTAAAERAAAAAAAASETSTPLSSVEAEAPTAMQSREATPGIMATAVDRGGGADADMVSVLVLSPEDGGGGGGGGAAAVGGGQSSNSASGAQSHAALTIANQSLRSSPPSLHRAFLTQTTDAASASAPLSAEVPAPPPLPPSHQSLAHAAMMMRGSPTDTTTITTAAAAAAMLASATVPLSMPPMPPEPAAVAAAAAASTVHPSGLVGGLPTGGAPPPARVRISLLTVKDLPAGAMHHIGGYICARSVKIVSRVKSRQVISQERDGWWMELREELRANARAMHCNTVLGYEEETQYHEDVVLLSLYGTAVMLDASVAPLRAGPAHLFRWQKQRVAARRNCCLLHLYEGPRRRGGQQGGLGFLAGDVGDLLLHRVCTICHTKPVPDVLLAACTLPVELSCEAPPRLVQVAVSKPKVNVKGVELAMAVSQALPFIEYALHKQLLFHLRLQQLNACFALRVSVVVGPDAIVGMLTGSGCRLAGLPVPQRPRMKVVDQLIAKEESVVKLRSVIASRRRRRRSSSSSSSSSSSGSSSSSSTSSSSGSGRSSRLDASAAAAASAASCRRGSREDIRGAASATNRAPSAAASASALLSVSSSRSSSVSAARRRKGRRRRGRQPTRRRRHRAHGRRGRDAHASSSTTSSSRASSPAAAAAAAGGDLAVSPASGAPSLHSSQGNTAVGAPAPAPPPPSSSSPPLPTQQQQQTTTKTQTNKGKRQRRRRRARAGSHASQSPASPDLAALSSPRTHSSSSSSSSSRSSTSSSSSSSSSASSRTSASNASSQSWVPTESSESDEDVYAPADEWRTTSGGVRTKARDYIVKIDDAEEADMMLGTVDATTFEDGVLLTLPYVPDSANAFDWQERLALDRRYSRASALSLGGAGTGPAAGAAVGNASGLYSAVGNTSLLGASVMGSLGVLQSRGGDLAAAASAAVAAAGTAATGAGASDGVAAAAAGVGGGGGGGVAGRMALTTRLLNEYCADAKRAFVHRACRMAMRTGQPRRLRVVNVRVEMTFVPNSADLQLRLEGCVMVTSSGGARLLRQLEDRAFRVCMYYTFESLSGLWQEHHHHHQQQQQQQQQHSPATLSNVGAGGVTPGTPVLSSSVGEGAGGNSHSTLAATSAGAPSAVAAAVMAAAAAAAAAAPHHSMNAATSMSDMLAVSSVLGAVDAGPAYLDARRLFTSSNAPFSLPYVQDITVPPPRVWSGVATAVSEDTAVPVRHTSTYAEYRDSRGASTSSLSRRWNAFVRATGQSLKGLVDRATGGGTGERRMQQQRQWMSSSLALEASLRVAGSGEAGASMGGAAGGEAVPSVHDANCCQPAARLPEDMAQLHQLIPVVLYTPLDYVAGRSISRYLGRLSQHFIREDDDTDTGDDLNVFFQRAEMEIMCTVQALVRLMGGNALLKHRIVYHEICDSDGSGSAFLFATVTGDVVQVSDTVYRGARSPSPSRSQQQQRRRRGIHKQRQHTDGASHRDVSDDDNDDGRSSSSSSSSSSGNTGVARERLRAGNGDEMDHSGHGRRHRSDRGLGRSPRSRRRRSSQARRRHRGSRRRSSSSTLSSSSSTHMTSSRDSSAGVDEDADTVSSSTTSGSRAASLSRSSSSRSRRRTRASHHRRRSSTTSRVNAGVPRRRSRTAVTAMDGASKLGHRQVTAAPHAARSGGASHFWET